MDMLKNITGFGADKPKVEETKPSFIDNAKSGAASAPNAVNGATTNVVDTGKGYGIAGKEAAGKAVTQAQEHLNKPKVEETKPSFIDNAKSGAASAPNAVTGATTNVFETGKGYVIAGKEAVEKAVTQAQEHLKKPKVEETKPSFIDNVKSEAASAPNAVAGATTNVVETGKGYGIAGQEGVGKAVTQAQEHLNKPKVEETKPSFIDNVKSGAASAPNAVTGATTNVFETGKGYVIAGKEAVGKAVTQAQEHLKKPKVEETKPSFINNAKSGAASAQTAVTGATTNVVETGKGYGIAGQEAVGKAATQAQEHLKKPAEPKVEPPAKKEGSGVIGDAKTKAGGVFK